MKKILFAFAVVVGVCVSARAANNCTGATYYDSDTDTCIACPAGYDYNQDAGKDDITDCQIHCDAGTYIDSVGIPVPEDYTPLEYIESTGTQYIDTGIIPRNYNYSAEFTMSASAFGKYFFGAGYGDWVGSGYQFGIANSSGRSSWGGGSASTVASGLGVSTNTFYTYKITKNGFYVNDVLKSVISNPADFVATGSLYIGRSNNPNGGSYNNGQSKWSMVKIYDDNGALVFDGIPARRNSDGVLGMYDIVTGTFFTNAGTGTFVAGADIGGCVNVGAGYYAAASTVNFGSIGTRTACSAGTSTNGADNASACTPCTGATYADETAAISCKSCPYGYNYNNTPGKTDITQCQIHCDAGTYAVAGYTQLEYIQSTGTQYINTMVNETDIDYIELEFANQSGNGFMFVNGSTQVGMKDNRYGTSTLNTRYKIKQELVGNRWYFTNITNGVTYTQQWAQSNNVLYLFAMGGPTAYYYTHAKVYGFSCYSNGTLYCNFIPARRNSDGVLGMYDMATKTFKTNAGTGTFIAGSDVGAIGVECINVGVGYYAAASAVNFGSVGTRTQCPAGLYTVGYGHGADDANDCGRILHIGDNVIYTRRNKITTPSVNINVPDEGIYYISLSPTNHNLSRLHLSYDGNQYTAYDDSLYYGERNFDTGELVAQ